LLEITTKGLLWLAGRHVPCWTSPFPSFLSSSNCCHYHLNCDDLSNGNSFHTFLYDTNQEIFNSELGFVL